MKKNFPLIAGISIPILMILFVAGSIYLPGIFIKPKYNFLYLTGSTYGQPYFVTDGQLVKNPATSTYPTNEFLQNKPQLFVFNVTENQGKVISFEDAAKLSIDSNAQSQDGFEVVSGEGGSGGFFPFFGGSYYDYNARYLKGHGLSKKLDLQITNSYYGNFMFLGWIHN